MVVLLGPSQKVVDGYVPPCKCYDTPDSVVQLSRLQICFCASWTFHHSIDYSHTHTNAPARDSLSPGRVTRHFQLRPPSTDVDVDAGQPATLLLRLRRVYPPPPAYGADVTISERSPRPDRETPREQAVPGAQHALLHRTKRTCGRRSRQH